MATKDQPYITLYAQDFLCDEKLRQCSAESAGVYIMLMCVLHKMDTYGTMALQAKDKQSESKISDFAIKISKHLPYSKEIIERALDELISEKVLTLDADTLYQKRMVKDASLSTKRATAGRKGGKAKGSKVQANTENEDEDEIEIENNLISQSKQEIEDQIQAGYLFSEYPSDRDMIESIVSLMWEIECSNGPVTIGGTSFPASVVKKQFRSLDVSHIEYIIGKMRTVTNVHRPKSYLMTLLYNAPAEMPVADHILANEA